MRPVSSEKCNCQASFGIAIHLLAVLRLSRLPLMHIGKQNNRLSNVVESAKTQDRPLKPVFAARKLIECMCTRMAQAARRGF